VNPGFFFAFHTGADMRSLIFLLTLAVFQSAVANDCKPLKENLQQNASMMGIFGAQFIKKIEETEAKAGREFKVGIIQRRGTDLKSFQLIKQVDANGNPTSFRKFLEDITYVATESGHRDRSYDNSPHKLDHPSVTVDGDLLKKRFDKRVLDYSHVGFVIKNHPNSKPELGAWQVVHLLDPCNGKGGPRLRDQSLLYFFADQLETYTFKVVVPTPEMQDAIEHIVMGEAEEEAPEAIREVQTQQNAQQQAQAAQYNQYPYDSQYPENMRYPESGYYAHYFDSAQYPETAGTLEEIQNLGLIEAVPKVKKPRVYKNYKVNTPFLATVYNAATLWSQEKDGNSNSFPLEVIAAAQKPYGEVRTRGQAIEILKQTGYVPSLIQGTMKTKFATIGWIGKKFRVNFKDQPSVSNFNIGQIVTALSIDDYLKTLGQFQAEYTQQLDFLQAK